MFATYLLLLRVCELAMAIAVQVLIETPSLFSFHISGYFFLFMPHLLGIFLSMPATAFFPFHCFRAIVVMRSCLVYSFSFCVVLCLPRQGRLPDDM